MNKSYFVKRASIGKLNKMIFLIVKVSLKKGRWKWGIHLTLGLWVVYWAAHFYTTYTYYVNKYTLRKSFSFVNSIYVGVCIYIISTLIYLPIILSDIIISFWFQLHADWFSKKHIQTWKHWKYSVWFNVLQ